jgi:hypothetical protein
MKKQKTYGGSLGRTIKHKNKIFTFGFALIAMVLFLAIGSICNDVQAAVVGSVTATSALKFASVGMFGLRPMFFRSPEGGGNGKSEEELLLEKIELKVKSITQTFANSSELTALKNQLNDLAAKAEANNNETLSKEVIRVAEELKALKENGKQNNADMSIKGQIAAYLAANNEKYEAFKRGEAKAFSIPLDLKVAGTMLVSTNINPTTYLPNREIVPSFTDIARNQPFLENYINSAGTSSARIVWVNKVNPDGNAAMTAEGVLKSLIDFDLATEESSAKKVTDRIKISTEMLEDIDFISAAIESELRYQIDIKVDEQLLVGDGIGGNLKGITEYASAYSLTTILTTNPNNADAIIAAKTQIETQNFMATIAFVNPIDKANMKLTKTTTGERLVSLNTDEDTGVQVVSSNQIPVGYVLVCDPSKYIKRDYKNFTISYGWENDDFSKNLVTVLGERRLHAYASDNNTGAFIYDTFDNIKTAITQP